jgi:hypothetical protein
MKTWISIFLFFMICSTGCERSDHREIRNQDLTISEPAGYRPLTNGIDLLEQARTNTGFDSDSREDGRLRDEARRDVLDAQDDLNSAVRRLSSGDWGSDIDRVKRRLNDREDANNRYSAAGGSDNLGSDIDRMRSQLRRLESDDWREVVPDIQRTNRSMDSESSSLRND